MILSKYLTNKNLFISQYPKIRTFSNYIININKLIFKEIRKILSLTSNNLKIQVHFNQKLIKSQD